MKKWNRQEKLAYSSLAFAIISAIFALIVNIATIEYEKSRNKKKTVIEKVNDKIKKFKERKQR